MARNPFSSGVIHILWLLNHWRKLVIKDLEVLTAKSPQRLCHLWAVNKGSYDEERLRMWARLIQMDKHRSNHLTNHFGVDARGQLLNQKVMVSPKHVLSNWRGRKVSIRTELIDQFEKWNRLHASGVIDETEYQELRGNILTDIKAVIATVVSSSCDTCTTRYFRDPTFALHWRNIVKCRVWVWHCL